MTLDTADERALWERVYLASPAACPALRADAAVEEYRERLPSAQACKVCGARERRECSECPARLPSGDAPPETDEFVGSDAWDRFVDKGDAPPQPPQEPSDRPSRAKMEIHLASALGWHGPTTWGQMLASVMRLREASRPPGGAEPTELLKEVESIEDILGEPYVGATLANDIGEHLHEIRRLASEGAAPPSEPDDLGQELRAALEGGS